MTCDSICECEQPTCRLTLMHKSRCRKLVISLILSHTHARYCHLFLKELYQIVSLCREINPDKNFDGNKDMNLVKRKRNDHGCNVRCIVSFQSNFCHQGTVVLSFLGQDFWRTVSTNLLSSFRWKPNSNYDLRSLKEYLWLVLKNQGFELLKRSGYIQSCSCLWVHAEREFKQVSVSRKDAT